MHIEGNIYKCEDRLEHVAHNTTQKDRDIENINKQKRPKIKCQKIMKQFFCCRW